jgi:hypothetical protein
MRSRHRTPKSPRVALPGTVFGRWTVVEEAARRGGERHVFVRCACGAEKTVRVTSLTTGNTTSCGCLRAELALGPRLRPARAKESIATSAASPKSERRVRLPMVAQPCPAGCDHDGRMAPGGSVDGRERDSKCAEYARCSLAFVKAHKSAERSHCPRFCPARRYEAAPERAAEGWGAMTFPSHGAPKRRRSSKGQRQVRTRRRPA